MTQRRNFLGSFLIRLIVTSFAVYGVAWLLEPNIKADSFQTAVLASLALGLINAFVKPVIILLTLPVTILSMGFFLLFINAGILLVVGELIADFHVENFWWALLASVLISLVSTFLNQLLGESDPKVRRM